MTTVRKLIFLSALVFLFSQAPVFAAEVSIETSVSRTAVPVGEQVNLDIIVSNAAGKITPPSIGTLDGFTAYSEGHSQEINIINGVTSTRSIYSYVLVANAIGKKVIGPFEVSIQGKMFKVAPVEIEVTASAPNPPAYSQGSGPIATPPARALPSGNLSEQDIFVKVWLDKDEAFVNEPVILTYTLYTRLSATYKGFEKEPVTTGFWVEDFPPEKTIRRQEQIINGSRYVVADVRKLALFPTEAGVFTLNPGVLATTVELRGDDSFDTFFSGNVFGTRRSMIPSSFMIQTVSKSVVGNPVTLTVNMLPDTGRPSDFTGAVGRYSMESSLDKTEVEAGNPVTLRVRIRGEGNLNTVQTPPLPKTDDFKIYDSSSSTNISKDRLRVEGEKVTETVIVPKKAGTFVIPALSFSYFEPFSRTYKTAKTEPKTLLVKPSTEVEPVVSSSPQETATAAVTPVQKEDVQVVTKDVRYLKTVDDRSIGEGNTLISDRRYWAMNTFFFLAIGCLAFLRSRKGSVDLKLMRFRRSSADARRGLRAAHHVLRADKADQFYEILTKAVYGYFADKLNVSPQGLSIQTIEEKAPDISPELFNQIRSLLETLSMGRFSTIEQTEEQMRRVYRLSESAIGSFEKVKIK